MPGFACFVDNIMIIFNQSSPAPVGFNREKWIKIGGFRINPGVITGSPDLAVCAPSEELLPGHEAEAGDAVLGPALAALHAALPAAALYAPDTDLASNKET